MSHPVSLRDLPADGERLDFGKASKLAFALLGVGGAGLLGSAYFLLGAPEVQRQCFAYSWLLAVFFAFTIACGGVFWTLLHHVSNSGWGIAVRRMMEAIGNLMPVVAVLALPLLLPHVRLELWQWMRVEKDALARSRDAAVVATHQQHHAEEVAKASDYLERANAAGAADDARRAEHRLAELAKDAPTPASILLAELGGHAGGDPLLAKKSAYLNTTRWYGFTGRFFLYFILLTAVIKIMRGLSLAQDKVGGVGRTFLARRLSSGFMPVFALCITFASIDWVKGLNHHWFSTMWGVYIFAGAAWASMAVLILVVTWLRSLGHLGQVVTEEHFHIKGKLLFAFTVFWGYIAFSQFFLIWYANIPEETVWFLVRNTERYRDMNIALVALHFAVPFVLLLPAWVKRTPRYLASLAGYVLVLHYLDLYLLVVPQRGPAVTGGETWYVPGTLGLDLVALVGVAGTVAGWFILSLRKHSLYPCRDPRLLESLHMHS